MKFWETKLSSSRQLDTEAKEAAAVLQVIHTDLTQIGPSCLKARAIFDNCRAFYAEIAKIVPSSSYYRYSDHWNWSTQRIISLIGLVVYLETDHLLVSRDTCAEILGLKSQNADGFHLDLVICNLHIILN